MKSKILGFAGPVGSGKSAISKLVATKLGWKWVSYGKFLRDEALQCGLNSSSREVLQTLGEKFINEGWEQFCLRVLQSVQWELGENLVIDGIRHVEAVETLRRLTAPSDVKIVFVDATEKVRRSRLGNRIPHEDIAIVDSHQSEIQVSGILSSLADYTVDGSLSPDVCATQVLSLVGSHP